MVTFAFVGIEMVGLVAGETKDPEKVLPEAINNIPIRIILFYLGSLLVIMAIYPWDSLDTSQSPFVEVFSEIGITMPPPSSMWSSSALPLPPVIAPSTALVA